LFLAYGYDETDHSPKLALLKEDGTILRYIRVEDGAMPDSALNKGPKGKGPEVYVAPSQFVPHGQSIVFVQNKTKFPLLEVSEAGAIRVIRPKLPEGVFIETLIPSDGNLYARVTEIANGSIYELNPKSGAVVRRFRMEEDTNGAEAACVHEGKLLAFEYGEGALIPLVGTAAPISERGVEKHR
jgi:hypothetical protein